MKIFIIILALLAVCICGTCIGNSAPPPAPAVVAAQEQKRVETCKGTAEMMAALDIFSKHESDWSKVYVKRSWYGLPVDDKKNVLGLVRSCLSKNTTVDALDIYTGKRVAYFHNITGFGVD